MSKHYKRFFTPNINSWKYIPADVKIKKKRIKSTVLKLSDKEKDAMIDNSTRLVDFAVSFTKTVVRISFILFVLVNVFILTMTTINYFQTGELLFLDTLITESYGMLRDVIAAYIIKAATENSLRIGFSVLSDFLDKKYNIDTDKADSFEFDDYGDGEDFNNIDIPEDDEDPQDGRDDISEDNMDGGVDFIRK